MKYTGPAKPIRTRCVHHIHPVDNRIARGLFLIAMIGVLLLDLFYWRP